jgi:hypothetical protein
MAKEISIVVKAYNQTKRAFAEIGKGFKDLGKGNLGAGFTHFGAALKQLGGTAKMVLGKVASFAGIASAAVIAAGAAVAAVGKKAIDAYKESAQANAKLEQALKNSAYAAGFSASELKDMADELQKLTGVEDEATKSAMAFLAVSGKIRGDNFKRATEAALDMAAALQKAGAEESDVESVAKNLGKALEDPAEGLAKLSRNGVIFTEQQKEQIKTLSEAGDAAAAQEIILAEVEKRYKGTAASMHEQTKAQDNLKLSFGELMEQVGKAINESQGFKSIIQSIADIVKSLSESGQIDLWARDVSKAMSIVSDAIKPVLGLFGKIASGIASGVRNAAAFAGGFVGGQGGIMERGKAGVLAAQEAESSRQAELQSIRDAKAAKKKAQAESDKKAQEAAKPELARRDAEEKEARRILAIKQLKEEASKELADLDGRLAKEEDANIRAIISKRIGDVREELKGLNEGKLVASGIEQAAKEARSTSKGDKKSAREQQAEAFTKELEIRKDKAAKEKEIDENEQELKRREIEKRWEDQLQKAQDEADRMQEQIDERKAMGAVGSAELRHSMRKEARMNRRTERMQKAREAAGMGRLPIEMLEAMDEDDMKNEERSLRLQRSLGLRGPQGDLGKTADKLIEEARKRGRKLSKETIEALRRNESRNDAQRIREAEQMAKDNLKAMADKAELEWRANLLEKNKSAADILKAMEASLDTLLRAAH